MNMGWFGEWFGILLGNEVAPSAAERDEDERFDPTYLQKDGRAWVNRIFVPENMVGLEATTWLIESRLKNFRASVRQRL